MSKIVVIGDVGGCAAELTKVITPMDGPDVRVIQVGDLVDRGPDNSGVLAFVRDQLTRQPRRWTQLIGNHESQYVGSDAFWPHRLADADARLLDEWWLREWMRVAAAVRAADGEEYLVTHAGLTVAAWRELDEPVTAATAADLLNTRPENLLWSDHGPLWPEAGPGLYEPWLHANRPMPFSQIHGHSTIVSYRRRTWMCAERIRQRATVDWEARHTVTRVGGAHFVGIDPKHGTAGALTWSPLILDGATLLS